MRSLAAHFPHPGLLAPCLLRVPAFFELPFGMLSFLTVLRWLDRGLYRRVAMSWTVWAASLSYTFAFCAVEWILDTPYAVDDIVVRVCSGLVMPLLIRWIARQDTDAPMVTSFAQMLAFAVSVWALGQLVLTVYDTALLYNLGHLGGRLPGAVVTAVILVASRWWATRMPSDGESGLALRSLGTGLRWALALFFIPALPIRYAVNFGTPLIAGAAGLLICVAGAVYALREGLAGAGTRRTVLWGVQIAGALLAGGAVGAAAVLLVTDTYYEAGVLRAAALCFAVAVGVCALTDRWIDRRFAVTSAKV
jgi:Na+-transporting NADH:ubiquinone oxidoreductase subunit NqrE